MENNQKPKYFLIFKILGGVFLVGAIIGFILAVRGFGDFENNLFMIGAFVGPISLFVGITMILLGFRPEMARMVARSTKYIQQQNKEEIKDIMNTQAEIASDAISTTAKAVKNGVDDTKFCRHCGKKINSDSKFCSYCGKEQ